MFSYPVSLEVARLRGLVADRAEALFCRRALKDLRARARMAQEVERAGRVAASIAQPLQSLARVMQADLPRLEVMYLEAGEAIGQSIRQWSTKPIRDFGVRNDAAQAAYNMSVITALADAVVEAEK